MYVCMVWYVCIYVYIYVCMYVYMYVYMYDICMYICIYVIKLTNVNGDGSNSTNNNVLISQLFSNKIIFLLFIIYLNFILTGFWGFGIKKLKLHLKRHG